MKRCEIAATGHVAEMDHGGGRRVGMRGLQSRISEVSRVQSAGPRSSRAAAPGPQHQGYAALPIPGIADSIRLAWLTRIIQCAVKRRHSSAGRIRPATVAPAGSSRSGRWR